MAEYGEWNRKGASLSDKTARKEYKVDQEFIIKGIESGKLEFRYACVWGSPFIKVLRRQLEEYITSELGPEYLARATGKIELQKIKKEIAEVEQQLNVLSTRKEELLTKKAKLEEIMATAADGKSPKKPKQNIKAPKNIN
jgi:hypothetical protein